jgi:hypothetical protein
VFRRDTGVDARHMEEVENDYDKNDDEENHDHDINSLLLVI